MKKSFKRNFFFILSMLSECPVLPKAMHRLKWSYTLLIYTFFCFRMMQITASRYMPHTAASLNFRDIIWWERGIWYNLLLWVTRIEPTTFTFPVRLCAAMPIRSWNCCKFIFYYGVMLTFNMKINYKKMLLVIFIFLIILLAFSSIRCYFATLGIYVGLEFFKLLDLN